MRSRFILAGLLALSGCDFLPAKDRSVELHGQVLDAETRTPIAGALWGISNSCGFGTLVNLAGGQTDAQGRFVARYEYPNCGDPFFIASTQEDRGYEGVGYEVYGTGRVSITVLLERRTP